MGLRICILIPYRYQILVETDLDRHWWLHPIQARESQIVADQTYGGVMDKRNLSWRQNAILLLIGGLFVLGIHNCPKNEWNETSLQPDEGIGESKNRTGDNHHRQPIDVPVSLSLPQ